MMNTCGGGVCTRCRGVKKIIFGALLLLNAFVWPVWLGIDGWVAWLAVLMIIGGFAKLVMPSCGHCMPAKSASMPAAKPARKSSRKRRK